MHLRSQLIANPKWQNHYIIRIIQHLSKSQHLKLRCAGLGRVRGSPEFDPAAVESSLRSPTLLVYFYEQITFAKVQRVQRIRRGNCCKNDRSFFVLRVSRLDSHRMKIWGQIAEVKNGETSELKTQLKRFWPSDHKALGGFNAQLDTLAQCSSSLGNVHWFAHVRNISKLETVKWPVGADVTHLQEEIQFVT